MNNPNLKKFYQNSPKPVNYLPNVLVDGSPQYAPTMSGLMLINPNTKDIWISAGKELLSDWINIVGGGGGGGLTSVGLTMPIAFTVTNSPLTANGSITITGAGNEAQYIDGTGALRSFPAIEQGLQSVITYDNILTENNSIVGDGTSITWNGNTWFDVLPTDTGYFRAQVGKFPPNFSQIYVEDTYAQIYSESSSAQFVKVDSTGVYVQTPGVDAGTAAIGQPLTLVDKGSGQVEYVDPMVRTVVLKEDTNINLGGSWQTITPPSTAFNINLKANASYTFKAVINYDLPTGASTDFGVGLFPKVTGATFLSSAIYYQVWDGGNNLKYFTNLTLASTPSPGQPQSSVSDTGNIGIVEGTFTTADADGNLAMSIISIASFSAPTPIAPMVIRAGSSITIYETNMLV